MWYIIHMNEEEKIESLLTRNVDRMVDEDFIRESLMAGRPLHVKLGIDPTSPDIHIGRAVILWKLRAFQDLGCQVTLIIGDFTGTVGDTSDKNSERPMLDQETVNNNANTYEEQALKILDKNKLTVRRNSEWLSKLSYSEVCGQADLFSVNDFIKRDVIAKRLNEGGRVSLREMIYPMMQGYDSVALKCDVELGGTDQWFNLLAGRTMQKAYSQKEQSIVTMKLMPGLDGRKMSSSYGNGIFLTDTAENMYGKSMTINDNLIIEAMYAFTNMTEAEIESQKAKLENGENPRNIKDILAYEITKLYHGAAGGERGRQAFINITSGKPEKIEEFNIEDLIKKLTESSFSTGTGMAPFPSGRVGDGIELNIINVLIALEFATSKSNARSLIEQRGVKVNEAVATLETIVRPGDIIQKGKLNYAKLI